MKPSFSYLFYLSLIIALSSVQSQGQQKSENAYMILISFDGFRWDYPNKYHTPNLNDIALNGVKATSVKPCFPTKTFPNHYSIATGLYPDHHGLVQNVFYDSTIQHVYESKSREAIENPAFYLGEPIWVTAHKHNIITACYFWIGSEAPVQGIYPDYWLKFNPNTPFIERFDKAISWLEMPEPSRPHLIMIYIDEPDKTGHAYGPDSPNTASVINNLDSLIGIFMRKINKLPFHDKINVIISSDHGMGPTSHNKVIRLYDIIPQKWMKAYLGDNPVTMIQPVKEYEDSVFLRLKSIQHLSVWKKKDIPERLHYGNSNRIFDIVVAADSAWSITWNRPLLMASNEKHNYGNNNNGNHGYDNSNPDMQSIFYATGPAFKKNYIAPSFDNIDIYPLIARILNIKPARVDGKLEHVLNLLQNIY